MSVEAHLIVVMAVLAEIPLCLWMRSRCEDDARHLRPDPWDYAGWDNADYCPDDAKPDANVPD